MFDLIIKNGTVIDGTGTKGFSADIGIEGGRITAIEKLSDAKAYKTINAEGKVVCPGFIDILDHSDSFWTLFTIPRLDSKVTQGITTIIGGNCGSSLAPILKEDSIAALQKWVDVGNVNINWNRIKDLLSELARKGLGLNFGMLVGHETLRRSLMGDDVRKITDEEIRMVGKMLTDSLKEGAFGMSTGLVFSHAKMTTNSEVKYLAEILKSNGALYASHIRGESEELLPSINETIQIGRETGVSIQISHLKAVGEEYWPDMSRALDMINIANEEGVSINFDIYPYETTGSVLYILLPDWVSQGGRKKMISRLKNPDLREKIIRDMEKLRHNYDNIVISVCPRMREIVGRKILDIARKQGIRPEEIVIDLLVGSNGHIIVFDMGILSEENIEMAIDNSYSIIASGDAAYNVEYVRTGELVHPRCFGTFPKIFANYVRKKKIIRIEKAIEKMTSMPAKKIGIKERGALKKGNFADVVVFDSKKITDLSDYNNPYRYSKGIDYVIINGRIVIKEGQHTGELAGKVLKKE